LNLWNLPTGKHLGWNLITKKGIIRLAISSKIENLWQKQGVILLFKIYWQADFGFQELLQASRNQFCLNA
jgi:hypothetical protein